MPIVYQQGRIIVLIILYFINIIIILSLYVVWLQVFIWLFQDESLIVD